MLDVIINMSKGDLKQVISKKTELSKEKLENIFPVAGVCIITTLKDEITNGMIDRLTSLIRQKDLRLFCENPTYNKLNKNLASSFTTKLGLSELTANKVSELFLSFVINYIKDKTSNNKGDIDNESLLNLLNGNNNLKNLPDISNFIKEFRRN